VERPAGRYLGPGHEHLHASLHDPQNAGGLAWDPGKKVLWVGLGGGLVVPYLLNGTPYNAGFRPFGPITDTIDGLEFVRKIHHHGKHHNDH
jgi:hypothetical protein